MQPIKRFKNYTAFSIMFSSLRGPKCFLDLFVASFPNYPSVIFVRFLRNQKARTNNQWSTQNGRHHDVFIFDYDLQRIHVLRKSSYRWHPSVKVSILRTFSSFHFFGLGREFLFQIVLILRQQ